MKRILCVAVFVVCSFCSGIPLWAQSPCSDTLVRVNDSVCEGMQYDFNGRILTSSGYYYDTLPRVGTECDSVVILQLSVLEYPFATPGTRIQCVPPAGYKLMVYDDGNGMFFHWTSTPMDSSLIGQEHLSNIFVMPKVPTVYEVDVDYRVTPQCPSSGRIELKPVKTVVAQMYVSPDHLSYDHLELEVEDYSISYRGMDNDFWCGRNWYLNDVKQQSADVHTVFPIKPWMEGDSVVVKMVAFTADCADSAIKVVPFRRVALYMPNAFTPGVEPNATFQPVVQGILQYELWIYDRRGTLVYHTTDQSPWDGTHNGRPCPAATYVYKCRYKDIDTPAGFQTLSGTLTLIR
ncbi:MAG: gliding motility-associated C-terminal domain-containing protein [Bacteroidales bacterium]|nr:gliding motility-associated C-terminal domain-containing protein [Bacteroidales bacterium]